MTNKPPPRASKTPPAEPSTLAEHEEAVRQRLVEHGQHGALAAFGKYTAAVHATLDTVGVKIGENAVKGKPTIAELEKLLEKEHVAIAPNGDVSTKPRKPAKAKKAK